MTQNMGTPGFPESTAHWSVKEVLAFVLRKALQHQQRGGRPIYGSLLPLEFRNVSLPPAAPTPVGEAMQRVADRVPEPLPFAYALYAEPPHDGCAGGPALVNLLEGIGAEGRVEVEAPVGRYQADVAIYPGPGDLPASIIEIVKTSRPSKHKIRDMQRDGVSVFLVDASAPWRIPHSQADESTAWFAQPVIPSECLANPPCGKAFRTRVLDMADKFLDTPDSFVGIRTHSTQTQEYLLGVVADYDPETWSHGEPELYALHRRYRSVWPPGPSMIRAREIIGYLASHEFVELMLWFRWCSVYDYSLANLVPSDAIDEHRRIAERQLKRGEAFVPAVDGLLQRVRFPQVPKQD